VAKPETPARARQLFFAYDGSTFYMSRDGAEAEYEQYEVPPATEDEWLQELTRSRVAELDQPGNWRSVNFLLHHGNFAHVDEVLAAAPKGVLWERCSFLELALKYLAEARERGRATEAEVEAGVNALAQQASILTRRARSTDSRARCRSIEDQARTLRTLGQRPHSEVL
jgi:hypothetical protein